MPQLNPAPWFAILIFSWLIIMTILMPKITAHTFPSGPFLPDDKLIPFNRPPIRTRKFYIKSWDWPWL